MFAYSETQSDNGVVRLLDEVPTAGHLVDFVTLAAYPHPVTGSTWDDAAHLFTLARRRCDFEARECTRMVDKMQECLDGQAEECPTALGWEDFCECFYGAAEWREERHTWDRRAEHCDALIRACEDARKPFTDADRAEKRARARAHTKARNFAVHGAGGVS